jgi:RNA polymerase sigma-70 factor, ECF subfamily
MIGQSNTATLGAPAPLSHISDQALVQSIATGDKAAFKLLYRRHRERVYRFVLRLTGIESMAEEIVNDVFLAVWRHAEQFEGKSQVATWLLGIARHTAISACRRPREAPLEEHVAAVIEDAADSPAASIEKHQRMEILQKCLAKLTPVHRDVIKLIYYQGNKIEQVAQSTGAPISTVKTRLHYARNRLGALLTEAGIDRAWLAI